jgi:hypothetical protein
MRNLIMGGVGVIVLIFCTGAFGDVVELPLDAGGYYDVNTPAWTYDFDLGVSFSEISHAYIDWSGEITGLLEEMYGKTRSVDGGLIAFIGPYPPPPMAGVWAGASTYPSPESFDVQSEFGDGGTWNDLLDGKETISIYYPKSETIPEIHVIDWGSATLNDATLVVEGTIIPEPSTLTILGLGFVSIIRQRHHFCISK